MSIRVNLPLPTEDDGPPTPEVHIPRKHVQDPNAPKRPLPPVFAFMATARPTIAADLGPDAPRTDIGKEGVRRWKEDISEAEKQVWTDAYLANKKLYEARAHAYGMGRLDAKDTSDDEAGRYSEENREEIEKADLDELLHLRAVAYEESLEVSESADPPAPMTGDAPPTSKKRIQDLNAPKRPLTPFFLYMATARPIIAAALEPDAPKKAIGVEGVRRWKEMPEADRGFWTGAYTANLKLYNARVHAYGAGYMDAKDMSDEEAAMYLEVYGKEIEEADLDELLRQRGEEYERSLMMLVKLDFKPAPTKMDETTGGRILGFSRELQRMVLGHLPFYDKFTFRQMNRYLRDIIPPVRDIPMLFARLLEENRKRKLWFEMNDEDEEKEEEGCDDWYHVLEELEKSQFMKVCNLAIHDDGCEVEQPLSKRFSLRWIGAEPSWKACNNCDWKGKMTERWDEYPHCWKCGGWNILNELEELEEYRTHVAMAMVLAEGQERTFDQLAYREVGGEADMSSQQSTPEVEETIYTRMRALPQELQRMIFDQLPFYDLFTLRQTNRYFHNIIPPLEDIPALFAEFLNANTKFLDEDDYWYSEAGYVDGSVLLDLDHSPFMRNCDLVITDVGEDVGGPMADRLSLRAAVKPPYWLICSNTSCEARVKESKPGPDFWCWKCGGGEGLTALDEWLEGRSEADGSQEDGSEEDGSEEDSQRLPRDIVNGAQGAKRNFEEFAEGESDVESGITLPPKLDTRLEISNQLSLYDRLVALPQELQLLIISRLPFHEKFTLRQTNRFFRNLIPPLEDIPALFAEYLTANTIPIDDADDDHEDHALADDDGGYVPVEVIKALEQPAFVGICNLTIIDEAGPDGGGPIAERLLLVAAAGPSSWMECHSCEARMKAAREYDLTWCWKCGTDSVLDDVEELKVQETREDSKCRGGDPPEVLQYLEYLELQRRQEEEKMRKSREDRERRDVMDGTRVAKRTFEDFVGGEAEGSSMPLPPTPETRLPMSNQIPLYDRLLALPQELQLLIFSKLPFYDLFTLRQTTRYFRNIIPALENIATLFEKYLTANTRGMIAEDYDEEDGDYDELSENLLLNFDNSAFMANCNLTIRDYGADMGGPPGERFFLVAAAKPICWMICVECKEQTKAAGGYEDTWCWKCGGGNLLVELEDWERQEERNRLHSRRMNGN